VCIIGETMSLSNDELLSNIKRQSKRLSKSINLPLRQAQYHLAKFVYQCDDWVHLRDSLKSDSFDNQLLLLASLQPNSDSFLYKLLNENLANISFNIKENTGENLPIDQVEKIIINIFGIEHSDFIRKIQ
tara:strand:- start:3607 stop:3996 length:390 start_codon:yes stop_codon:yes gene_type:complete